MFIAFEGIDGSGKTTQIALLHKYLEHENIDNVMTSEPTEGPIGRMIKHIIRKEKQFDVAALQLLFTADRSYHVEHFIRKWDMEGKLILCDRYIFSTLAFGGASGLDKPWLFEINKNFPMPDITIVLDISPRLAMERVHSRMKEYLENAKLIGKNHDKTKVTLYEKIGFLAKVRMEYKKMKSEYDNYFIISGSMSPSAIHKNIVSIINENI
ncbi:MAG: dTMP kinase [Candidatus Micrarchaeaceae archaeon]